MSSGVIITGCIPPASRAKLNCTLLTYPPSSSRCPSWGSHSGGMYPLRDIDDLTYRHREPTEHTRETHKAQCQTTCSSSSSMFKR
ncbi:unnamed protein product [Acanthoscelides obtectus]|uniref:Uncharacterized protein n=1 Tax=Acanthoscelides obtectus TaxID=200917 RepID=A0A9P0LJI1_ACAOB|nr:unnamed protein product [Acanthoscelides obtectus]CAK1629527.1 hypothetical protein AOBTE_LOCUS5795 [Acanthoscelides obtectus]